MTAQTQQNVVSTYEDRPEVGETFGDAIRVVSFDGNTWRVEVAVTRIESAEAGKPIVSKQYPSVRLVLSAAAGLDLMNKLTEVAAALEAQGILKKNQPPPPSVVHH